MSRTVQAQLPPMPLNSIDGVRPAAAKVSEKVNRDQLTMTAVVKDALTDACGSLKAAAITMHVDQGQLTRELQAEGPRLGRFDDLAPHERAVVVDRLHEHFGSSAQDPRAVVRRLIRDIRRRCDELEEAVAS